MKRKKKVTYNSLKESEKNTRIMRKLFKEQFSQDLINFIYRECRIPKTAKSKDGKIHIVRRKHNHKNGKPTYTVEYRKLKDLKDYKTHFSNVHKHNGSLLLNNDDKIVVNGSPITFKELKDGYTAYENHDDTDKQVAEKVAKQTDQDHTSTDDNDSDSKDSNDDQQSNSNQDKKPNDDSGSTDNDTLNNPDPNNLDSPTNTDAPDFKNM